ncbi:MAG: IS5 family transposase [Deltaproteobacteria bacterium]|nr:IS5 family transposase [Deltaproteobacteria bacterium]
MFTAVGPGRPPCDWRQMFNGILYLLKSGCQWRMLPREFGQWNTVYSYFKRWRTAGGWAQMREALRQGERRRQGRQEEPSAGSVDSQSIKAATQATEVGFDGGKQVKGRKRQILVDTLGLVMAVVVTAANTDDRVGGMLLLTRYCRGGVQRLGKRWVDGGYQAEWLAQWVKDLKRTHKIAVEVTGHEGKGVQVVPWRWAVERTFAWLLTDRRHSRDYERLTTNSEAMLQLSMIRLLLKRLA